MSEKARRGPQFSPHPGRRSAEVRFEFCLGAAREGHQLERSKLVFGKLTENFLEQRPPFVEPRNGFGARQPR